MRSALRTDPAGDVRRSLAASRAAGAAFDLAWRDATADLSHADLAVISSTRGDWYRSYVGKPPTCGAAAFEVLASTRHQ
jgi:hypothetical protein